MNIGAARVVLRVRSATDVLDLAAPFCLRGWRFTLPLAAVVLVPAMAVCLVAHRYLHWEWRAVWGLAAALYGLCQAPFTAAYGDLVFMDARDVRLAAILKRATARFPVFLVAYIASWVVHVLGLSVVVLPVFTLSMFLVVPEVVLLENAGPFAAIGRSVRAVRGRGPAAFGVAAALLVLPVAGLFAGEVLGSAIVNTVLQLGEPFGTLWKVGGSPYALAGFFATAPLAAAARFLMYIDLRTRKEGWDIQLKFMAIAAADADAKSMPARRAG